VPVREARLAMHNRDGWYPGENLLVLRSAAEVSRARLFDQRLGVPGSPDVVSMRRVRTAGTFCFATRRQPFLIMPLAARTLP
jgi:hypothetical protein